MDIIIYGSGGTGADALSVLGDRRVKCFVATKPRKAEFCGKEVISIEEMEKLDLTETMGMCPPQSISIPVVTWEEADKEFDCLIMNLDRARGNVSGVLDRLDGRTV